MKKIFPCLLLMLISYPVHADGINFSLPAGFRADEWQVPADYEKFAVESPGVLVVYGKAQGGSVLRKNLSSGEEESVVENLNRPISGVADAGGKVFVAAENKILRVAAGKVESAVQGLPAGDFGLSPVSGKNESLYFGLGTVTNSGIVGQDNAWLATSPSLHDLPCKQVDLAGVNVTTDNFLTKKRNDKAVTGSFMPFNAAVSPGLSSGFPKCSGAVYTLSPADGRLAVYAWGFHAPRSVSVSDNGAVWVLDRGMEDRGSRPVTDGLDSLYRAEKNGWYGWPDYQAGTRIDQPKILAADPGPVATPFLSFPLGKYFSFAVSPDSVFPNFGAAASERSADLIDLNSGKISNLLALPAGQKVLDAQFGPDGYYLLVQAGENRSVYRIRQTESGAQAGAIRRVGSAWAWAINGSLLILGLAAYFFLRRPPRTA